MRLLARLRTRVRALSSPTRRDEELADEFAFHLEQQTAVYQARGLSPEQARAAARRDFGSTDAAAEACRDARGVRLWVDASRDVRVGWRAALRAPGTTLAAIGTLAIGIGAATAMFSIIDAVLLRPLPFPDADRLVRADQSIATGALAIYESQARAFSSVGMFQSNVEVNLGTASAPERVVATVVSDQLLPTLGIAPSIGRGFRLDDSAAGAPPVAILGHGLWRRQFGGRADVVGATVRVDGVPRQIVGVLPARSFLPLPDADLWLPAITRGLDPAAMWGSNYAVLIGRLRPGVTRDAATADLRRLAPIVRDAYPWRMPDVFGAEIRAEFLLDSVVGDVRQRLWLLGAAVLILLAAACANVATLLLSRGLTREREFAVRAAIGASRRRLLQQLLTEALVLWVCGGLLGLLLAWVGLDVLRTYLPPDVPRLQDLSIDWRAGVACLAATLFTGIVFGALPAWRMSRSDLVPFLKPNDGGVATSAGRQVVIRALVVAQLASAVVLMSGSVLLSRSLWNLTRVPPGLDAAGVVSARLTPDRSVCDTPDGCADFYDRVTERLAALPQVSAVGVASHRPFSGETNLFAIDVQDHPVAPGAPAYTAMRLVASSGYFDALDVDVTRGRGLTPQDATSAQPVILVNEAFARRFWPGQDPIGKRVRYVWQPTWRTIVGVVADVREAGLAAPAPLAFYLPYGQDRPRDLTLFVESRAPWTAVATDIRRVVRAITPDVPVSGVRPVQALVDESLAGSTALLALITTFGVAVLALSAVGTYGVLASNVSARRRELGIRLALGASPRTVRRLVLRDAARLCAIALVLGVPAALLAARSVESLLFGTGMRDIVVPLAVLVVMTVVALGAALLPALRASRVDPLQAVRDA